jgi:hypothetical protein
VKAWLACQNTLKRGPIQQSEQQKLTKRDRSSKKQDSIEVGGISRGMQMLEEHAQKFKGRAITRRQNNR